ncbi:prolyl oligopeptidase family serine peptidase [Porphyrobacter algicida]|uniref:Prolyl oligopeptidase family serine peptidase n=1 Tax=Qipengyuania algicida TaxID=1836209 RepID=A0A845AFL1_9SPHN|nr:dienelactone hydrolase family protein [Qipengyuania algicida]MXP28414.1 prolyl oligopeptidase family serine peptidase [Qipengyuania algicida]
MSDFETVAYRDGDTALTGLLARPEGSPKAVIVVYPTIMNSTPAVEAKAKSLADAGYLAMIADFYGSNPEDMAASQALAAPLRADAKAMRDRMRPALHALADVAGAIPMAAIGFCMGGQAALEMAREGADLVLAASFHGLLETHAPADVGAIKARILVCHGDADPLVPREQVLQFWEEMDRAGANWHFHSYSGVKHGFTNPQAPSGMPAIGYDASADHQSWAALMSMLDEVLG